MKYIQRNKDVDGGTPSFDNILIVPSTFVARQSTGEWDLSNQDMRQVVHLLVETRCGLIVRMIGAKIQLRIQCMNWDSI